MFSPNGKLVATSSRDKSIRIGDFSTGKELSRLPVNRGLAPALVFSLDSKSLNAGGWEKGISVWDAASGKALPGMEFLADRDSPQFAFSPDEKLLATLSWGGPAVRLWDVPAKKMLREFGKGAGQLRCFSFSPDGRFLCTAGVDSKIRISETSSGRVVRVLDRLPAPAFADSRSWFASVAYSPDGRTLAAGSEDGMVRLWDVATGQERSKFDGHRGEVKRLAFSPDGAMLASGSGDRTVMVWDVMGQRIARVKDQAKSDPTSLHAIWEALCSPEGPKAYGAIKEMVAGGPMAVAFLNQRLGSAAGADDKEVAALITQLDNDNFAQREKAVRELKELGNKAEYALEAVLAGQPSLEVRRRVEGLLELLELTRAPERLRALRAVEVLEHIGTPEARTVLERVAKGGPRIRLTLEALASLARLKRRS